LCDVQYFDMPNEGLIVGLPVSVDSDSEWYILVVCVYESDVQQNAKM